MAFANPIALLALSSIIPIVILYLIKPKPRDIKIPSLMFILDLGRKEHKYQTMLKKFIRDPLMLMQLLFLTLLALAMASPYLVVTETVRADHTVIVLDASASMQATGSGAPGTSRFDLAKNVAEKFSSGKTSIILAKNVPIVALAGGSRSDAKAVLQRVKPSATTSGIGNAILLAKSMIEEENGAIVVISDFSGIDVTDDSISTSKMLANAAGIDVTFKQVGNDADNIGIIYGKLERKGDKYEYICTIKNYMDRTQTVPIEVFRNSKKILSDSKTIPPHSTDLFALTDLQPGATVIVLKHGDSLAVDDRAYIAIPEIVERKVLFISENKNPPAKIALSSLSDTECSIVKPPVLPSFDDYDIVVVGNITKDSLLPGTFNDLATFAGSGGGLVILASDDLGEIDTNNLLPVQISGKSGSTVLNTEMVSEFIGDVVFEDVSVIKHLRAGRVEEAVTNVVAGDGSPMLSYRRQGDGTVVYFGFGEGDSLWNDFHTRVDYPIFWRQIVDWMSGVLEIEAYNVRTGRTYPLVGRQEVITPSEPVTTDNLLFDEVGGYQVGDMAIAANLYDSDESDLSMDAMTVAARNLEPDTVRAKVEKDLWAFLTVLVMLLAGLELYYLRARGEL
ncbi:MAG: BatA and WFA domain-containing protein [Euryarchaeota archaeon]|nr:BatA and WFA domain-containing protein [Euryarchaeota archaeon]